MENFILCAVKAFNWSHDFQVEDKFDNNTVYRKGNKKSRLFVYDQIIAINQFDQSNAIKIFSYNKFSYIWCILIKHLFLLIKKPKTVLLWKKPPAKEPFNIMADLGLLQHLRWSALW